ncbi:MAG: hypothetical protein KC983_02315 [Phycisphaerales bacterium]|nr:hypothetical protein [Phycisphaerales bacterium]
MTHRKQMLTSIALLGLAGCLVLTGCSGDDAEPVAQTKTKVKVPPPPPPPKVASIDDLKRQLNIDDRVMLSEDVAPAGLEDRKAVLTFFDAFAKGDANKLRPMVTVADQMALASLVDSKQWDAATGDAIYAIEVRTGSSPQGDCALAVIESDQGYEPQLWYYSNENGRYTFEAASTPPGILDKLSGADWIKSWHAIIAEELALADQPDDVFSVPQVSLEEESTTTSTRSSGPGMAPGRNMPTGPGREAPGKGTNPVAPGGR